MPEIDAFMNQPNAHGVWATPMDESCGACVFYLEIAVEFGVTSGTA